MRLKFDGSFVSVNSQVDQSLLIIDTRKISMNDCMVGRQVQRTQVSSYRSAMDQRTIDKTAHS